LQGGLDYPNQLEKSRQIPPCAQATQGRRCAVDDFVAVVYAVMIEFGFNTTEYGAVIYR
jgi:hypothetical protein